ncbi:MAG: tRNA-dihydrouridine synthase family protein [Candidatus Anstonellaceae archaeon]
MPLDLKTGSLALAPMAGYTNYAFRFLEGRYGADVTFSEFIAAEELIRLKEENKILNLLKVPANSIGGIQLFGSNSDTFREVLKLIEEYNSSYCLGIKFIDLNLGCPAQKILKTGAGASLLYNKTKLQEIAKVFCKYSSIPHSAKLRILENEDKFFEICELLIKNNFSFLSVHCRTKNQKFSQPPKWEICKKIKEKLDIFVFANGSISSAQDVNFILKNFSDGVMIGRKALLDPFIFLEAKSYPKAENINNLKNKIKFLKEYINLIDESQFLYAKNLSLKLFRNFKKATIIRQKITLAANLKDLIDIIEAGPEAFE